MALICLSLEGLSTYSFVQIPGGTSVLTIFSAIFIPLTFIAGIYGINFKNVPELHFRYSYFIMWGVMVAMALVMLRFSRRKKWL